MLDTQFKIRTEDIFWGPTSLLSNGYLGYFPRCKSDGEAATEHVVLRKRIVELYFHTPIFLHGDHSGCAM
jgi:hypothetical protein